MRQHKFRGRHIRLSKVLPDTTNVRWNGSLNSSCNLVCNGKRMLLNPMVTLEDADGRKFLGCKASIEFIYEKLISGKGYICKRQSSSSSVRYICRIFNVSIVLIGIGLQCHADRFCIHCSRKNILYTRQHRQPLQTVWLSSQFIRK